MKTYTLDEVKDKYLGEKGTTERDTYENELRLDLIGEAIKQARKERKLTQTQLGELDVFIKYKYRLTFSVFHYLQAQFTREKSTLSERKQNIKYLNPYFTTDKGLVQLESKQTYQVLFNEENLLQEFSRREKKKCEENKWDVRKKDDEFIVYKNCPCRILQATLLHVKPTGAHP